MFWWLSSRSCSFMSCALSSAFVCACYYRDNNWGVVVRWFHWEDLAADRRWDTLLMSQKSLLPLLHFPAMFSTASSPHLSLFFRLSCSNLALTRCKTDEWEAEQKKNVMRMWTQWRTTVAEKLMKLRDQSTVEWFIFFPCCDQSIIL